ncbi:hypothetical protein LTR10_019341 [Elasticomyces elasticus]|uniref:Uncharacterized protein n=1 Tax=Exophiala sideris TaxID=1016849 RepID=A0ABR0J159_9EURO|nr:hypothetical protein LTR10_019341 [Elasticomyces elasticus]KAK5024342.1 hypothetical protein LTS07_008633 [Exophiala sideris]KAK5030976.1 hypothetical protein LTR13_007989 [Exophiala sideris]KAK5054075.1 hypothetical protein LTR69_009037 [Exophiala sideris]KAK5179569.1 hypothetical protein LTR44_008085 [Eurotiomycetes sp. CCFEE 6388]
MSYPGNDLIKAPANVPRYRLPSAAVEQPFKVPLKCKPSYGSDSVSDQPSFTEYPASQGWDTERILIGDLGRDPEAVEAFLQQWLLFGLIHAVVNSCGHVLIDYGDFVRVDVDGTQLVTTKCLPGIMEKWKEAKDALPSDQQLMVVMEVDDILADARYFVGKLTYLAPSTEGALPIEESILLSIIILGETLEYSKITYSRMSLEVKSRLSIYGETGIYSAI